MSTWRILGTAVFALVFGGLAYLIVSALTSDVPSIVAGAVVLAAFVAWEVRHERLPEEEQLRSIWRGNADERFRRLPRADTWAVNLGACAISAALIGSLTLLPDDGETSVITLLAAFVGGWAYVSNVLAGWRLRSRGELPNVPARERDEAPASTA